MRALSLPALIIVAATAATAGDLSADDRELLETLLEEAVYDPPANAERALVPTKVRTVWCEVEEVEVEAWLVAGPPPRAFLSDGRPVATPADVTTLTRVDLAARARTFLLPRQGDRPVGEPLALAAWLHRRGQDGLAAEVLAKVGSAERREAITPSDERRADLAWSAFADLVHAYMVRADDEALASGEHLLRRYADQADAEHPQARTVVDDLRRRQRQGTFGRTPPAQPPEGFASRPVAERVAWLVQALDEVDARQWGQPGGVGLGSDWRVAALIELGDAAVPALLDALESDPRLTRSVHFWRDFSRHRTVLTVREAALVGLMSILRVRAFRAASTGDSFSARGEAEARATARRLRDYWERYGGLTLEARMRATLLDPEASQEEWREAAQNLAELPGGRHVGSPNVWMSAEDEALAKQRNPALDLERPTAAEAVLVAMDRDLTQGAPGWKGDERMTEYSLREAERHYVECLITLGDARLLPVARARHSKTTTMRARRRWAHVCHALGDPAPLASFVADFASGRPKLPPLVLEADGNVTDEPGARELIECLRTFERVPSPEADRALVAAATPGHPYHDALELLVVRVGQPRWRSELQGLFAHPFHLALLLPELDHLEPTGATLRLDADGRLRKDKDRGTSWEAVGDALQGAEVAEEAQERRCDVAAVVLAGELLGLPAYHPLLKERDARLARLRADAGRFARGARRATPDELRLLDRGRGAFEALFLPDLPPLGRPATAGDVATGRAVFHLEGRGAVADLKLPALAWLRTAPDAAPIPVIVVQAEALPDGQRRYGLLGADRIVEAGADQVEGLQPWLDPSRRRAAAERFLERAAANDLEGVRALLAPDALAELEAAGQLEAVVDRLRTWTAEQLGWDFFPSRDGVYRYRVLR